jgi:hypothetical protein
LNEQPAGVSIEAVLSEKSSPPRVSFVRDVARLYHHDGWLFLKMLLPAAIFGYFAIYLCEARANEIASTLPHGPARRYHIAEMLEMAAFRFGGFVVDWMFYSFAFGAMTVAVSKLANGQPAEVEDCFQPVSERLLPFLTMSLLLLFITYLACIIFVFLFTFLRIRFPNAFSWMAYNQLLTGFAIMFPGMLIASRFGLAIPALILEQCSIKKSLFRSDELTQGCWTILAILLLESVFGSLLILQIPQWLFAAAFSRGFAPWWMSWLTLAIGLLLGVLLQPHLLVGFALLHVRRSEKMQPRSLAQQIGY